MSDAIDRLQAVFSEVLDEAEVNPAFADRLARAMEGAAGGRKDATARTKRRGGRRPPGVLDPFAVHASGGEAGLEEALGRLDIEQLKDIVAEHGMDTAKLALKWKTPERLTGFIVTTVAARAKKGQAFRTGPHERGAGAGREADAAAESGTKAGDSDRRRASFGSEPSAP